MRVAVLSTLSGLLLAMSGCIFDTAGSTTSGAGGKALDAGTDRLPTVEDAGDTAKPDVSVSTDAAADAASSGWLPKSTPEEQGLDSQTLIDLTERIRDLPDLPIFSLLISRKGTLVYELYTSRIDPDAAHYVMSVTKSVLSATVGAAIARGLIQTTDVSLAEALPLSLFGTKANQDRFRAVTLTHAMGMSALDALLPPHGVSDGDVKRGQDFWDAKNRVVFGLTQNLLPTPGSTFQYQDITPVLAAGCVQYAAKQSLFDFAKDSLFEPMQFANAEWMHQDASGTDMAGYGLRLRPVDMQKLGVLYLRKGVYGSRQLLPIGWVDWSFRPWMKSHPSYARANYGAYFWTYEYAEGWTTRMANGWRGQRIAIVPEQELVVTMTADMVSQDEEAVFQDIMMSWVKPAVERGAGKTQQSAESALALAKALADVTNGPSRIDPTGEPRMVPTVHNKEKRIAFVP